MSLCCVVLMACFFPCSYSCREADLHASSAHPRGAPQILLGCAPTAPQVHKHSPLCRRVRSGVQVRHNGHVQAPRKVRAAEKAHNTACPRNADKNTANTTPAQHRHNTDTTPHPPRRHPDFVESQNKGPHFWDECTYPPVNECTVPPSGAYDTLPRPRYICSISPRLINRSNAHAAPQTGVKGRRPPPAAGANDSCVGRQNLVPDARTPSVRTRTKPTRAGDFAGYTKLFDNLAKAVDSNPFAISGDASSNTYTASGIWLRGALSLLFSRRMRRADARTRKRSGSVAVAFRRPLRSALCCSLGPVESGAFLVSFRQTLQLSALCAVCSALRYSISQRSERADRFRKSEREQCFCFRNGAAGQGG